MVSEERIIEVLGGVGRAGSRRSLKPSSLREQVRTGFRFSTLEAFQRRYRISPEQLRELIDVSERTIARRKLAKRLSKAESDRLYRSATPRHSRCSTLTRGRRRSRTFWGGSSTGCTANARLAAVPGEARGDGL
jgi:hypothetical protein